MRNCFNNILIALNICDSLHLVFAIMDAVRNSFGEQIVFCHVVQEFCTVGSFWGNNLILFVSILFALAESALYNTVIKTFITPSDRYLLIQRRNFHIIKGSISFLFNLLTKPHLNKKKSERAIFRGALPRTLASYLPLRPLSVLQDLPLREVLEEIVHCFHPQNS